MGKTTLDKETDALVRMERILSSLDDHQRERVLAYHQGRVLDRYRMNPLVVPDSAYEKGLKITDADVEEAKS